MRKFVLYTCMHCCLVRLIIPNVVLVQPGKTRPFITERLVMGRKESNQTNKKSSEARDVKFVLPLPLCPFIVYTSSEGSNYTMCLCGFL